MKGKRFEKKPTFGSVGLAAYARDKDYDSIELVGLCTDICVISNALLLKAVASGHSDPCEGRLLCRCDSGKPPQCSGSDENVSDRGYLAL